MKTTARQVAAEIVKRHQQKWGELQKEVMELPEYKNCRDQGLAGKIAKAEISKWVWNTGAEDVEG